MRVTTDLWVSALVRQVFADGGFAAIVRRGASEAGSVFLVHRDRMGGVTLFGPAPQSSYDSAKPEERLFVRHDLEDETALDRFLERERRFDQDIWVVEVEPGRRGIESLIVVAEQ